jgi:single-strand DNA-binding protein
MRKIFLSGKLGADAEVRTPKNGGDEYLTFSVATEDRFKNAAGGWDKKTVWVRCTGKQVGLAKYLTKGSAVSITGRINASAYEKNGKPEASLDAYIEELTLLSTGGERTERYDAMEKNESAPAANNKKEEEDDLPF